MHDPATAPARVSTKATTSLVCSIISLFLPYFWFILAIAAIVLGGSARTEIAQSGGSLAGDGRAKAAVTIGWISLVLGLIVTIALEMLR